MMTKEGIVSLGKIKDGRKFGYIFHCLADLFLFGTYKWQKTPPLANIGKTCH